METLIEFLEHLQLRLKETFRQDKSCYPEMVCPRHLSESASRHNGNTSTIQYSQTVEDIHLLSRLLGCLHRLL